MFVVSANPRATELVARGERHCQQYFLLDQIADRHFAFCEHPIGRLRIVRIDIDFGFRGGQHQNRVEFDGKHHAVEAALAAQWQDTVNFQAQRTPPEGIAGAAQLVMQLACVVEQAGSQARKVAQRPSPGARLTALGEFEAVDVGLLRHKTGDGIISKNSSQNKAMGERRQLVLASTSAYRRALLERLGLPFECASPGVDETAREGESPAQTAQRLACAKAAAVAPRYPNALVIGSDQVASLGALRLEKPGDHQTAAGQLALLSGQTAQFDTALCLIDATRGTQWRRVVPCRVTFRRLDAQIIETYLRREQPYDCAGSAKSEGLGIALIERIDTEDPTALIGLPLIALSELLAAAGQPVVA